MENVSTRVTHILNGVSCHNISVGHPKCKANKMYPWSHLIAMSLFCPPVPWGHHQTSDKNTMSVFQSDNKGKKKSTTCSTLGHRQNQPQEEERRTRASSSRNLVSRDKRITPGRSINDSQCDNMKAINREFWRETSEGWMTPVCYHGCSTPNAASTITTSKLWNSSQPSAMWTYWVQLAGSLTSSCPLSSGLK